MTNLWRNLSDSVITQVKNVEKIGNGPDVLVEVTERGLEGFVLKGDQTITVWR